MKHIAIFLLTLSAFCASAQTTLVDAKKVVARDSMKLKGVISEINTDTALSANSMFILSTQKAIKSYIATRAFYWNQAYNWGDHNGLYLPLSGGTVSGLLNLNGGTNIGGNDPYLYFGDASSGFASRNGARLYSISGKLYWGTQGGSDYLHSFYLDNSLLNAEQNFVLPDKSGTIALLDDISSIVGNYIPLSQKGVSNGVATLDAQSKIPMSQIPDALVGSVKYVDVYDASTNTPALPAADASNKGWYYIVNVAGSQQGLSLNKNDWVISNGMKWDKVDNNNLITSVFGRVGPITAQVNDYSSFYLPYTGGTMTGPVNFLSDGVNKLKLETFSGGTAHVFVGDNGTIGTDISGSDVKLNSVAFRYGSYRARVTANTLTADREILLPDKNGTIALADGSNATGTWPVNISGTSNNSSQWGTVPQNFAVLPSGTPKYLIGIDGSNAARFWNNTAILNWLGIPPVNPGGETLQSVMNRGASTTVGMTFATPNPAWDHGLDILIGSKNNRATIQSHNISNNDARSLDINPYGGDVNIGSAGATSALAIYGGKNASSYPTLGQFSGGFRLANIDGQYGLDAGVNTDGNTWLQAGRSDGTATAYNLVLNPAGGNVLIGANSTSNERVQIYTGGNRSALSISGNSGSNVLSDFSINRSSSNSGVGQSASIQLNDASTGGNHVILQGGTAGFQVFTAQGANSWIEGLRLEATGNILIGDITAGGSNRLKVQTNQPAGTSVAYVNNTNTATNTYGLIVNTASTDAGSQIFSARSNSVDRFTVVSNGNVGFGTVSPARQIEEWNNGAVEFLMTDASQGTDLKRWRMYNASQNLKFGYTNDALTNATDVLTLSRVGDGANVAVFNGIVSAQDAVNSHDLVTKQQLDAAINNAIATTSGSWSPTLLSISNYDILNASYVRTGNVITIALTIRVNSGATTSSGTSNVYISGMPLFGKSRIGSNTIVGKLINTSSASITAPFYETNYDSGNPNNIGVTLPTSTIPLTNNGLLSYGGTGDKILIFNMTYQIG